MAGNKGSNAREDAMFGPEPWTGWVKRYAKLIVVCMCVIVAGLLLWYFFPRGHGDNASNKIAQQTLETSLKSAVNSTNDKEIINTTSQLINGAQNGIYKVDDATLARYHLQRAASYMNEKKYGKVAADSEAAITLSSQTKSAAYEFEFEARYMTGERQTLIPLLNQMIEAEKAGPDPTKGVVIMQFQQDITDLQHNKGISF